MKAQVIIFAGIMGICLSNLGHAQGLASKLKCHSTTGGYIISTINVDVVENNLVTIDLERWYPADRGYNGLKIGNDLAANARITIPKAACDFKATDDGKINLMRCYASNGNTTIELKFLNGTSKTLNSPHGPIEIQRRYIEAVSGNYADVIAKFNSVEATDVGTPYCK